MTRSMKANVSNKTCIRRLSFNHMKSAPTRNLIAVIAIALTSVLFTAIFTIASSLVYTFEQSNFRTAGSSSHGSFKALNAEMVEDLKTDPLIKEYGVRHFLGMAPAREPFNKSQVEVSYVDAVYARHGFIEPTTGRLPAEGTDEAAADTRVLALLGVPAEIGAQFTLPISMCGSEREKTTEIEATFTLCGYWEYDEAMPANNVLLPDSRVKELLKEAGATDLDGLTGTYSLDVMFRNASHIEENMNDILTRHGYPTDVSVNVRDENGRLLPRIGVNWGYLNAQYENTVDPLSAVALALVLVIIIFTGHLIIYNVFQISVANDIRFYGLLKTIGTTGKQLKRIVSMQALLLSAVGIPVGLLIGYGFGALFVPVIINAISDYTHTDLSVSPWIFLGSALFSLATVTISCRKPGRMAAKVSPVEAVRYTEHAGGARCGRRTKQGSSLGTMAMANLGRNKKRTAVTLFSLSLAVLLLNLTVTFTGGFDMEKYVSKNIASDFHVACANYYQSGTITYTAVPDDLIDRIGAVGGVTDGGRTYGMLPDGTWYMYEPVATEEEFWRQNQWRAGSYTGETLRKSYVDAHRDDTGQLHTDLQLYGMEPFCLEQLTVTDGDLSKLSTQDNAIAAVYLTGDYGEILENSNYAKVGDRITMRRVTYEWTDAETGRVLTEDEIRQYRENDLPCETHISDYYDKEYEVAATVTMPHPLSYRYFGDPEFVMSADTFMKDTGTADTMYYAFDVDEGHRQSMEDFLADFTQNEGSQYDYESRLTTEQEFASMRNMFLLGGGALSFIVGMIGVLNFLNTILTGILARRREFAVLQSVGMTGRQLKGMLIREGVCYAVFTVLLSFLLILATAPFMASLLGSTFWFFTYRFTILPAVIVAPFFLALGALLPLIVYRFTSGKSVVERLREAE